MRLIFQLYLALEPYGIYKVTFTILLLIEVVFDLSTQKLHSKSILLHKKWLL